MSSAEFRPQIIVLTGVTRGLGRAMAGEFIRRGHSVVGCARTKEEIQNLAHTYPDHDFQSVDVASDAEVKSWAHSVIARYGAPNFLLNNAAVLNHRASLWEVDARDFSDEVDINIKGVVNVVRHFVPSMVRQKSGVIVNFTSRWGHRVEKGMAPYCATKWAVVALTRALAEELRPAEVAAIALNPGIVRTGMLERYMDKAPPLDLSGCLTASEWADAAVPFIMRLGMNDTGKMRNLSKISTNGA